MAFDRKIINNETDIIGKLGLNSLLEFGLPTTVGVDRIGQAVGSEPNIFINLIPKGTATLRVPVAYETLITDNRDIINKGYADSKLAGVSIAAIIQVPTEDQDGYSIIWDDDAGEYTLGPSASSVTYASGVEDVETVVKWGGPVLDRHTDIQGAETFDVKLGTTASKLLNFELNTLFKAELTAGTAKLILNGVSPISLIGGAALSSIVFNAGGGIILTDNQVGASKRGLRGAEDYSVTVQDTDYIQKAYADNRLGGKFIDNLIKNPTVAQNGFSVVWNNTTGQYTLAHIEASGVSTIPKVQSFVGAPPQTAWLVDNGTILSINFVEINGNVQTEGVDYTRSGQTINIVPAVAAGMEIGVHYWEDIAVGGGDPGGGGGGGSVLNGHFIFSTSLVASDPGLGNVRLSAATFAAALNVYIDDLTIESVDLGAAIQDMATGDEIRLQLSSNDDNNVVYKLSAMPIDNGGWWTLPVLMKSTNGAFFANGADLVCILFFGGTGIDDSNIDGGTATSIYNTISGVDGGTP